MSKVNSIGTMRMSTQTGPSKPLVTRDQMCEMTRKKAFELYEKRGRRPGHATDDWLEAERIIKQMYL